MNKKLLLLPFIAMTINGLAQNCFPLKEILYYGGVEIKEPVLCDSINVLGEKNDWKNLLKSQLNEPAGKNNYNLQVMRADSTFQIDRPVKGNQLSLWKFFIMPENFMPLKLELKSSNAFEVYVDGIKNTEKTTKENSKDKAGSVTIDLKADPRQYTVVVKMLSAATDSCQTTLSVLVKTEKRDSTAGVFVSASDKRLVYTPDFLMGKRITSTNISPNGNYALINYTLVHKDGSKETSAELTDLISGKLLWKDASAHRLEWMPKTNVLYYTSKGVEGKELRILDPVTLQEKVLVKNLPEAEYTWSPKENFLIGSVEEDLPEDKGELHRLYNPEDRQEGFRSRSSLYKYDLSTGLFSRLTYGKENAYLHDISADGKLLLFGTRIPFVPEAPFSETNLYLLNLETMKTDTIWHNDKNAIDAVFSPDSKKLLLKGAPDSFNGIGLNIAKNQISNPFDIQAYIMDLATKKVEPITKDFNPSLVESTWSKADGRIYFSAEDKDYVRIYSYDPASKKIQALPISPDVANHFETANASRNMVYFGSTYNFTGKAYVMDLRKKSEKVIADPGAERLSNVRTGKMEDWNFKATDGTTIYGRYYLPPSFDPDKKIIRYWCTTMEEPPLHQGLSKAITRSIFTQPWVTWSIHCSLPEPRVWDRNFRPAMLTPGVTKPPTKSYREQSFSAANTRLQTPPNWAVSELRTVVS